MGCLFYCDNFDDDSKLATILLMKLQIATTSSIAAGVAIQKKKNSFPPTRETFTGLFRLVSVARDLWLVPP